MLGLAGCAEPVDVSRSVPQAILVAGDTVVQGPPGFCVDPRESRSDDSSAFVLMASCAAISGDVRAPAALVPAVLTISVARQGSADTPVRDQFQQLERLLVTPSGRAAMAHDGNPDSVEILETEREGAALLIHTRDSSDGRLGSARDDYWRAITDVNGRLITISALSFDARPVSSEAARETVSRTTAKIRALNKPGS